MMGQQLRAATGLFPARPSTSKALKSMLIGHINLAPTLRDAGQYFIRLVEALAQLNVEQHILVRDDNLARRLAAIDGVVVGPVVHSSVMAYCLLPRVDVAHAHDLAAGHAALLSTLTRSIPYILTHRGSIPTGNGPVMQSVYRRAARVLCQDDAEVAMLRHWLPGLGVEVVANVERNGSAASHLRAYQNSQRMPIAGSNGIQ